MDANSNPLLRSPQSDEEPYATISSAPPKRRAGRTKFRETRHPVFKGVRRRNADRWVCEVREPNKKSRIWLGTFPTAEMAARAHDVAAMALRGRSACLNFADSAWLLPVPESSSRKDIQKAAAQAAEAFRPAEHSSSANSTNAIEMPAQDIAEELRFGNEQYYPDMVEFGWMSPPPAPPSTSYGMSSDYGGFWDDNDGVEVSLWSYSI